MTWPASDVVTTNLDASTDTPDLARGNLLDLVQKFNALRNHVSAFMQTFLSRTDAATARTDLQLANHNLVTVSGTGDVSTTGSVTGGGVSSTAGVTAATTVTAGTGLTVTTGGASITGNVSVTGTVTASGDITAFSDERLKEDWHEIEPDFVHFLATVRAGTFKRKGLDGRRYAGVSAQSLQQLLPEAVHAGESGHLSVAYGPAAMVACIALAREVQALRREVAQLKGAR